MAKYDYNIVVIGGGSAGLVSSYIASATKAKVALIEQHNMGGDCLNTGCVPSKALLRSAMMLHQANRAHDFGFKSVDIRFYFDDVMARVKDVINDIKPHDSVERYSALGVDCFEGKATLTSKHSVEINGQTLTARSIIIATGASPLIPKIEGIEHIDYLTSNNLWQLTQLPEKLVILGGGPIGCEMAQAFARFGSKVTIVEMAPRLLPNEDPDVSDFMTRTFDNEKIQILTHHRAKAVRHNQLIVEANGVEATVDFDRILIAVGRKANIEGFGLEALGIALKNNGTILANDFMQTNIPNIFVCGDVTGPYQFTHMAAHQACYACVNALLRPFKKFKVDYRIVPYAIFTDPELARVGLNELEAQQKNIPYEVTTYGIDDLDRAIADSEAKGFVRVLTVPKKDIILGVTIVGYQASNLISEFILAMKHGIGLNKLLSTIHIYPTMAEANKYVAGQWKRQHTPAFALTLLEKFHRWRR